MFAEHDEEERSTHAEDARNRIRTRVEQWQARLKQLKAERKEVVGEARHEYVERLQELQETIAEEVRRWAASIDDYDMDPAQTTQKALEEQVGLREIERQVNADLAAWKGEGQSHDVG